MKKTIILRQRMDSGFTICHSEKSESWPAAFNRVAGHFTCLLFGANLEN